MIATDTFISEMNNLSGNFLPAKNEHLGKVTRVVGMTIEASGISAEIGAQCEIEIDGKNRCIDAEVIGFDGKKIVMMPIAKFMTFARLIFLTLKILGASDPVTESRAELPAKRRGTLKIFLVEALRI